MWKPKKLPWMWWSNTDIGGGEEKAQNLVGVARSPMLMQPGSTAPAKPATTNLRG
jgi:hypothetical protein